MVTPGQLNRRAELFEQLAAMIAAGLPLTRALETAAKNRSIGVPRKVLLDITAHLQEGHTFTDAMQLASGQRRVVRDTGSSGGIEVAIAPKNKAYWLSDFDVALLSAGEESGRLDSSFRMLGRYYSSRARMIRETISGSMITAMTLHVFLLVFPIGLLQLFVLGIVNNQYSECLPFIIEKLVAFSLLYGGVWALAFAGQGNRSSSWRAVVESIFTVVPLLRSATKFLATARLAMALDALLSAGVPIIRSWELAAASCGSSHLKREILKRTPELEHGSTPGDMVSQIRYFPDMFVQLYQTGEISGKLDESLTRLHTYFEEEGFRKLRAFYRVVQFTIYFTIAILVAIFVIRFWLGYFNTLLNVI
jgi:type IV pilus assembly protein PilC